MKKALAAVILFATAVCLYSYKSCKKEPGFNLAGKTFVWEKPGFGGDFTISFRKDGTYTYYEGYLSSYMGRGNWNEENGIVKMTETGGYESTFYFALNGEELVFISEGSSRFIYVSVENGDRFILKKQQ